MKKVSIRQLVYKFYEYPWVVKREIAHNMGVIHYAESFETQDFHVEFFKRLSAKDLVEALKHRLFPDYSPEPETHPCG